jgi:hypothetical protein
MVNKEILMMNNFLVAGRWCAFALLVLVCVFFTIGCKDDDETNHTDPSFLVGTWSNPGIAKFSINADYTFVCDLVEVVPSSPARVRGRLDYSSGGLGPNDYLMQSMTAGGNNDPDETYNAGNTTLSGLLGPFQGLLATLTPSAGNQQFTFTTTNQGAQMFFGGIYTKE